jgi:hypothetical protein
VILPVISMLDEAEITLSLVVLPEKGLEVDKSLIGRDVRLAGVGLCDVIGDPVALLDVERVLASLVDVEAAEVLLSGLEVAAAGVGAAKASLTARVRATLLEHAEPATAPKVTVLQLAVSPPGKIATSPLLQL